MSQKIFARLLGNEPINENIWHCPVYRSTDGEQGNKCKLDQETNEEFKLLLQYKVIMFDSK